MKETTRWYSQRLGREATLARWGSFGAPVLIFPTAGGDAEEIERFHIISALGDLIGAGRIKVYSCDSVAGHAMVTQEGSPRHRMWMLNQFQEYVRHEVVPAIRMDCRSEDIEIVSAGSSIGAFNALAVLCRYPDVFSRAICLSGTYDIQRFLENAWSDDFYVSSPLHYLPNLEGPHLDAIRKRLVVLASGQGRAEDIGETWRAAKILGSKGIPNRVVPWGEEWAHDWPTWRKMLPIYLGELDSQA